MKKVTKNIVLIIATILILCSMAACSRYDPGAAAYKPVIYLYPEETTDIDVQLEIDGELTVTYPKYKDGWSVTAEPDGTLTDESGIEYNYLYWEGITNADYEQTQGFCIPGEETAEFLETSLEKLGLNRREANEFIVYWLPQMQENAYNIITFQTDAYTSVAELIVSPAADTVIRVFMTYSASDKFVVIEAQDFESEELKAPERTGFIVVEWGGTELK